MLPAKIRKCLSDAFTRRAGLFADPSTDSFRLFHSAADGINGLTVDLYASHLLVQYFTKDLFPEHEAIGSALEDTVSALPVPVRGALLKDRTKFAKSPWESRLLFGTAPQERLRAVQNGTAVLVDLLHGQNTGLFLDMREIRRDLAPYCSSADVLNLFSYTGMFSVYALKHGASGAVNVDLSRPYLNWAEDNYRENGFPPRREDFISGDCRNWLDRFRRQGRNFNLVILDPPTFSRNRSGVFSIKKNFPELLGSIAGVISRGYVLSCVNAATVTRREYVSAHPRGWEPVFFKNESEDFSSGEPYLKAGLWRVG